MPVHLANRWRAAAFGLAICGVVLMAGTDFVRAQEPTREEIIESIRAKQLTRCPRFDAKAGCGVAQPAGNIDVEIHFGRGSAMLGAAAVSQLQALGADLGKPERRAPACWLPATPMRGAATRTISAFRNAAPVP
jgi:hypothetical protein